MNVEIVDFPETLVACLEHRGPPAQLMASVGRFIQWRKSSGESPYATSKTFGIPYGDPDTTTPDEFRHDICGSVEREVVDNEFGVVTKTIPGGRCARIRNLGSTTHPAAMRATIEVLYRDWLPESGEELRDFPCFFHFVTMMPIVSEREQATDIYLPLKNIPSRIV